MIEASSSVDGQDPNTPDRAELLGLYKTAIEEYRFEVNLGWDRQKFFVGLNVSLLAAFAGFAKQRRPCAALQIGPGGVALDIHCD